MRISWTVPLALGAAMACGGAPRRYPTVSRPTPLPVEEGLRCGAAAIPSLAQRELLGLWVVTLRPDTLYAPAMTGEIRFRADVVRPDLSPGQSICKGCLFGEYFGPFAPLLEEPPRFRDLAAVVRADFTVVMSIGSFSPTPNHGDLALCGRWDGLRVEGIWWQNLATRRWGTFAMQRID